MSEFTERFINRCPEFKFDGKMYRLVSLESNQDGIPKARLKLVDSSLFDIYLPHDENDLRQKLHPTKDDTHTLAEVKIYTSLLMMPHYGIYINAMGQTRRELNVDSKIVYGWMQEHLNSQINWLRERDPQKEDNVFNAMIGCDNIKTFNERMFPRDNVEFIIQQDIGLLDTRIYTGLLKFRSL